MAVISGSDYLTITVQYGEARKKRLSGKNDLFDAVYTVVTLQAIVPEVDLLQEFWQSYLVNTDLLESSTLLLGAIRALQEHVLREGDFSKVDNYLDDQGLTVNNDFAALSADAGFPIDSSNIDS